MSQSFAAVANECDSTAWVFKIEGNSEHPKLDRRDGNSSDFFRYDEGSGPEKWTGREIAVARVEIPNFGGNAPSSKKQKRDDSFADSFSLRPRSSEDKNCPFGNGGPITMAMRGRNLTTGFSNGTIANTILPDRFNEDPGGVSANHLSSCSALAPDEWHHPMLEFAE